MSKTKAIKKSDASKPWMRQQEVRKVNTKKYQATFLIYCEGESTEPAYFNSFVVTTGTEVKAIGTGRSKTSLVKHVLKLLEEQKMLKGQQDYDKDTQIWVVFDRDLGRNKTKSAIGKEKQDFNNAIKLAENNDLKVAYSNDAFELWFVLHRKYIEAESHRDQYYDILSNWFSVNYGKFGKNREFAKSLYSSFLEEQPIAIKNAKKLHEQKNEFVHCDQNPCTTVYLLVKELNKYLRK